MSTRVSIGQAAANALAAWLKKTLDPDVIVFDRWPEADIDLPPKAISIAKVGTRSRIDAFGIDINSRINLTPTLAQATFKVGGVEQPLQLDIWADSDDARDDLIAQLDDVLYRGINETLNGAVDPTGAPLSIGNFDPIRDGILLQLLPDDGFYGFVDYWFDDANIDDSPDSIQRAEYRATLPGDARLSYAVLAQVPRLLQPILKVKAHESPTAPAGQLFDTTTMETNPSPPPAIKRVSGTST